jgi:hypothetical protein
VLTVKRAWTIVGVQDVPVSVEWYQALFGQPAILPAHDYFGQIIDSDGTVLLCFADLALASYDGRHERISQPHRAVPALWSAAADYP